MMESKIYVSFILVDVNLDVDDITKTLKIAPSRTWRTGDLVGKSIIRKKNSGWELQSSLPDTASFPEHIDNILEQLEPCMQDCQSFCLRYYAEISCVIESYGGDRPEIHLNKDVMQLISKLNASIDVDLYIF